ncbi:ABC transporter ATP-binding protein [Chloroflexota bacterium]
MATERPIFEIKNLKKYFPVLAGVLRRPVAWVKAVDDISFELRARETFSIIGESGCGKTTTARTLLMLHPPTSGQFLWKGKPIFTHNRDDYKAFRTSVQAVFQDPGSSLDPRMRAEANISEPLRINLKLSKKEISNRVEELLTWVGLNSRQANHYPHEFSGGQRQRLAIARSLALDPQVIILDEPVSALDVSIQAQIMNLLKDLQRERELSYLLIAHDFGTIRYMSHRTAVMYLGQIVEQASTKEMLLDPLHPYTQGLISAAMLGRSAEVKVISGEVPSSINPPTGCRFHPRCAFTKELCRTETPLLREIKPGHLVRCHL